MAGDVASRLREFAKKSKEISEETSQNSKDIDMSAEKDILAVKSMITFLSHLLKKAGGVVRDSIEQRFAGEIMDKKKEGEEALGQFLSDKNTMKMFKDLFGGRDKQALELTKECLKSGRQFDIEQIASFESIDINGNKNIATKAIKLAVMKK